MPKRASDDIADLIAERNALLVEIRLLELALYREQRERRRIEEQLAQLVDTDLEPSPTIP